MLIILQKCLNLYIKEVENDNFSLCFFFVSLYLIKYSDKKRTVYCISLIRNTMMWNVFAETEIFIYDFSFWITSKTTVLLYLLLYTFLLFFLENSLLFVHRGNLDISLIQTLYKAKFKISPNKLKIYTNIFCLYTLNSCTKKYLI